MTKTMTASKPRILVITPVSHIAGVCPKLESIGTVTYMDDPNINDVIAVIGDHDALYTNPNKSKVFIGKEVIDAGHQLKAICTASTGTNHIDKPYAAQRGLKVISITEERDVINRISSTAELAFALTMSSLRNVVTGHESVLRGEWDYTQYIGRQMNCLTIGVIGYGRLGSMYADYCKAFDSRVLVFDPYKTVECAELTQVHSLQELLEASDVVSIHVHVTEETTGMIDAGCLKLMKEDVLIVNTSRGDIVNEADLVEFLKTHPKAKAATDVLADEVRNRMASPLLGYASTSRQVTITPHIGGMTREAQEIAYGHAALLLGQYFETLNT